MDKLTKTWVTGILVVSQLAWGIPLPVLAQEPSSSVEGRDLERVSFVPQELQPANTPIEPSYVEETVGRLGIVEETLIRQRAEPDLLFESQMPVPASQPVSPNGQPQPPAETPAPEEPTSDSEQVPEEAEEEPEEEPTEANSESPIPQANSSTQNSAAAQAILDWINTSYTTELARRRVREGLQPLIDLLNNLPSNMQATTTTLQNGDLEITLTVNIGGLTFTVGKITLHKIFLGVVIKTGPITITGRPNGTTITIATPGNSQVVIQRDPDGNVVSVTLILADGTEIILYQAGG